MIVVAESVDESTNVAEIKQYLLTILIYRQTLKTRKFGAAITEEQIIDMRTHKTLM